MKIREILLTVILASLALWGCVPDSPTAAIDEDAPVFIDPLPSPTPTWSSPGPDDSGQIIDCALEAPLCVIDVAVVDVAGEAYLGVELRVVPIPGKWQPDGVDNVLLDVNVSVQRNGETVAEIHTEGHSVAVAPAGGGIILTEEGGAPLSRIDSSELGDLLADPRRSPIAFIAYEADAGDLILLDADRDSLATIYDGDAGVLLANLRPSPSALVFSDPTESGFLILNAEAEPLVVVDISNETVWLLDSMGDRVAGLVMLNGLVVIAAPSIGPVGLVSPNTYPAANADPGEMGLRITILIPMAVARGETYDIAGTISLFGQTGGGERVKYESSTINLKGVQVVREPASGSKATPLPSPTPAATLSKATAAPKSGAPNPPEPTAKPPDPTAKPPDPTTKPLDDGGKPTATTGK